MQAARSALLCFVLFLSILSCHSPVEKKTVPSTVAPTLYKPDSTAKYMGVYTGSFGGNGILTLVLNYISGRTVSGYDVHQGLRRNVNGEVNWVRGIPHFVLKEPGDNRFDGSFSFLLDTASRKIEGEWVLDNPASMIARRVNVRLAPMEWDESAGDNEWNHADTALDFHNNGTCQLVITPENEHAQKIIVRGNFDKKKDVFLIEWEKNPYMAGVIKMVEYSKTAADDKGDSTYQLCLHGGGMELVARGEPNE
ncbi:MAG TPA: hypothetical protein VHC96_19045 [Puia sp.]|jgi:hypothetical protein|nr:hypothetical protein [Puia sp.]